MSVRVVVDASVLLAMVLPDPAGHKDYARQFLFSLEKGDIDLIMIQLCQHEIAAKLITKMRGGFIKRSVADEFLEDLQNLRWTLDVDIRQVHELFQDAERLQCRGYDAAYLRACITHSAQIATLDQKLLPHVKTAKIRHWQPT